MIEPSAGSGHRGLFRKSPSHRFVTVSSEADGLFQASNIFRKHHGGEGVMCLQAAQDSGYW